MTEQEKKNALSLIWDVLHNHGGFEDKEWELKQKFHERSIASSGRIMESSKAPFAGGVTLFAGGVNVSTCV